MSEYHPNKARPMRPRWTWRRMAAYWPLLVWILVVVIAAYSFLRGVQFNRVNGVVDVIQEAIAPDEDGRVRKILVSTGQQVKQGDPLVEMDTSVLDTQIQRLEQAMTSDLENRIVEFETDLHRLRSELRELQRDEASDKGELDALNQYNEALDSLMAQTPPAYRAGIQQAKGKFTADVARLNATIALYPQQMQAVQEEMKVLEDALKRLRDAQQNPEGGARASGDLARLQELRILRDRSVIRSSHDGTVDRIDKDEGEYVAAGTPVLRVVAHPQNIRAFLPEDQLHILKEGDQVWIAPLNERTTVFTARIKGISPRINTVPDTSSPLPNQILHGREVVIEYPEDSGLTPGQRVVVHLDHPGRVETFAKLFKWEN